jgi:tetratricopeptide (TPR) repeat protein
MKMKKDLKIPYPVANVLADNSRNWKTLLSVLGALIVEFAIFYYYLKGQLGLPMLVVLHCAVIVLLGFFLYISYKQKDDLRYPLLLLLAAFGMGPLGVAGMFIFMLLRPLFSLAAAPFSKWFRDLFPEHGNIFINVFQRIRAGWDDYSKPSEIIPFYDFFNYGSLMQKQAVLDQVVEHYKPEYSPILRKALKDPQNVIRIQAAAIQAKIDHDFEVRLKEIERERYLNVPETTLQLAKHYDYFAFLHVFDSMREQDCQQQAVRYYREYLKKRPEDQKAWLAIGRLLVRKKAYAEVSKWFEAFKSKFENIDVNAYPWYLEALYQTKDYDNLSSKSREYLPLLKKAQLPKEVTENIEVWGSAHYG